MSVCIEINEVLDVHNYPNIVLSSEFGEIHLTVKETYHLAAVLTRLAGALEDQEDE